MVFVREVKGASFGGFFEGFGLEVDPFLGDGQLNWGCHFGGGGYLVSWLAVSPAYDSSKITNRFHLPFSSGKG